MKATEKRVAIIVHNYFEQVEFEKPLETLKEAGVAVSVLSADTKNLHAMIHAKPGAKFLADLLLEDAEKDDYDAVILPSGVINADKLRMNKTAQLWVCNFLDKGKLVAAICHAPWLLVSADAVEERRLTSYYTLQDDIRNAGGEWIDHAVIVDKNLITSRDPDDLKDFDQAILDWLNQI